MHSRSIPFHLGGALAAAAGNLWRSGAGLWRTWSNRREITLLLEADDHMLADIGLTRADVVGALSAPADVDPSHHLIRARGERMRVRAVRRLGM